MSKQTRVSHPIYNLLPTEIAGFDSLAELALDMRWSWNHATDEVWRQLAMHDLLTRSRRQFFQFMRLRSKTCQRKGRFMRPSATANRRLLQWVVPS